MTGNALRGLIQPSGWKLVEDRHDRVRVLGDGVSTATAREPRRADRLPRLTAEADEACRSCYRGRFGVGYGGYRGERLRRCVAAGKPPVEVDHQWCRRGIGNGQHRGDEMGGSAGDEGGCQTEELITGANDRLAAVAGGQDDGPRRSGELFNVVHEERSVVEEQL
jgi:hypothetical protein